MRNKRDPQSKELCHGFSLIELLIVVAIITLVLAGILTQIDQVQQRSVAEQGKVDDFQQARDFLDQIFRDARQMGYPNFHNFDISQGAWQNPLVNDSRIASGLVKLTATELDFEGDVDGSGNVSVVSYKINGNGSCATCIQRAQVTKINTIVPLTQVSNLSTNPNAYSVEVQNVQNVAAIFTAYDVNGNALTLPIDITTNNGKSVAQVRTIQAQLKIASPSAIDPKTGQQLEADIEGRVQVVNCSMATTQSVLQAAGINMPGEVKLACQP